MAITKDNKPLRYKRSTSALKKVWDYMRRNRTFRFGDVMMVTGVSHRYLKNILWHLKGAGYVDILQKAKPYSHTQFVLKKCTGAKSPSIINGAIYDYNTGEEIKIEIVPTIVKLLDAMQDMKMSKQAIAKKAEVSFAVAKRWFKKLDELGVISAIEPLERIDGHKAFFCDQEKIQKLLEDIESGAFRIKGALC